MYFDPMYFLYIAPAVLLGMWAQYRIHSAYNQAQQLAAPLSGAAAARHILDSAGLNDVQIEEIPGQLTDHYDPRDRVLRLSPEVYESRTLAAVGIAAHESGHALQHARGYAPLALRNAAVPAAGIGTHISFPLIFLGFLFNIRSPLGAGLVWLGIGLFAAVVVFQVINLPVEFNASSRAKVQLVSLGIVNDEQLTYVSRVLNAAALTYVAATLQAILTLLYFLSRVSGGNRR